MQLNEYAEGGAKDIDAVTSTIQNQILNSLHVSLAQSVLSG